MLTFPQHWWLILALRVLSSTGKVQSWHPAKGKGWQELAEVPPWKPHTGSIAVALADGSMLLTAGQAGEHGGATFDCFNCSNQVWHLKGITDASSTTWTDLSADVPWASRWGHSAVALKDDTVWMMFGCCEPNRPTVMFRDIWTYNPTTGSPWTRINADPPFEGIQAAAVAVQGSDIWVTGGWSQSRGTLSLVSMLNTETRSWTTKSKNGDVPWPRRADHAAAISPDGTWLLIFGGQHEEGGGAHWTWLQDSWRVPLRDAIPSKWEQLGDLAGARSSLSCMVLPTGWVITLGGSWTPETELLEVPQTDVEGMKEHHKKTPFKTYNDVLALDLAGGATTWKEIETEAPWLARDDAAATVSADDTVVIFGGGRVYGGGSYLQDVWKLDKVTQKYGLHATTSKASTEL